MDRLRARRARSLQAREQDRLRSTYGDGLVGHIAKATRQRLSLGDFIRERELGQFDWPPDIRNATGLVAAYISRVDAIALLECIRGRLAFLSGAVGYHEKPFLGVATLSDVDPVDLLAAAQSAESTVLFHNDSPPGILMVDCYLSPHGQPFSVVVQGDELVKHLEACFQPLGRLDPG